MDRRTVWVLVAKVEFNLPQGTEVAATVHIMEEQLRKMKSEGKEICILQPLLRGALWPIAKVQRVLALLVMVESADTLKLLRVFPVMTIVSPLICSRMKPADETVARLNPEAGVLEGLVLPVTVTVKVQGAPESAARKLLILIWLVCTAQVLLWMLPGLVAPLIAVPVQIVALLADVIWELYSGGNQMTMASVVMRLIWLVVRRKVQVTADSSLQEEESWGVFAVRVYLFWRLMEQQDLVSIRYWPSLQVLTVKFEVDLHYLGRARFLTVTVRLALVMESWLKGLKEKLLKVVLKEMMGVEAVLDPRMEQSPRLLDIAKSEGKVTYILSEIMLWCERRKESCTSTLLLDWQVGVTVSFLGISVVKEEPGMEIVAVAISTEALSPETAISPMVT